MLWNLKHVETFVWVAKLGSFRRTAERLSTTQPNISVRIAELEAALGVKLFERDAGSVTLTQKGQALLSYAERVLVATEEFSTQSGRAGEQIGVLRLGVTEMIAQTWLRDFLKKMKAEFPHVAVELMVDLSINLRRELVERALDLAFLNGPITDFNINNIELGSAPMAWVASPKLHGPFKTTAQLAAQTILCHARNTRSYVEVTAHFRENFAGPVRIVSSNNLAACLQMAIDGLGIATIPLPMAKPYLKSKSLVRLSYNWVPTPLAFTASYAHSPASGLVKRAAELGQEIAVRQK